MANPTLVRGSGNFTTSSSTTLTLFNTQTEGFSKSANLINIPLPLSNSSGVIVFDLLGVTREVRVKGTVTISDSDPIGQFTNDLDSLLTGNQGNTGSSKVGYTFNPTSISGSFTVYVNDVTWDFTAGDPNTIEYSLTLFEADGSNSG